MLSSARTPRENAKGVRTKTKTSLLIAFFTSLPPSRTDARIVPCVEQWSWRHSGKAPHCPSLRERAYDLSWSAQVTTSRKFVSNNPTDFPMPQSAASDASGYRRCYAQRLVNPAEIVLHVVEHHVPETAVNRLQAVVVMDKGPSEVSRPTEGNGEEHAGQARTTGRM
jgi:hypothetical protein